MTATRQPTRAAGHQRWSGVPGRAALVATAAGALAFDLALQHPPGLSTFAAVLVTGVALDLSIDVRITRLGRVLLAASLLPAAVLVLRDSPWLSGPGLAASGGLILLAAVVRDEPCPIGHALGRVVRPETLVGPALSGPRLLWDALVSATPSSEDLIGRTRRVLRSLTVGAPIVLVLVALLASADAVFASLFEAPFGPVGLIEHMTLVLVGGGLMAALLAHRAWARPLPPRSFPRPLGPLEVTFTLSAVFVVYGVFVATQVVAITAGDDYVRRTTGLTYAEYARQGFFQLLAAAVLTLVVVLGLLHLSRAAAPSAARRRAMLLAEGVVVLTVVVVAVALRRLFLYEAEFGLTMLRLTTIVVAVWIGIVFLAVGLSVAGRLPCELGLVVVGSGLGVLLALAVANPEAIVARRNVDRFGGTEQLDVEYLVHRLGADAVPTVLSDPAAADLLCREAGDGAGDGLLTFNLSRDRAASAVRAHC